MRLHPFFFKDEQSGGVDNKCTNKNTKQNIEMSQLYRLKEITLHASLKQLTQLRTTLADIYFERSALSLRTTEWGIFNFSKHHRSVVVQHKGTPRVNLVNIYETYLDWRRNYKRKLFDQYRREAKIYFLDPVTGKPVPTTPAQVNFFWFLISEEILPFLLQNCSKIREHKQFISSQKPETGRSGVACNKPKKRKQRTNSVGDTSSELPGDRRALLIQPKELKPHYVVGLNSQFHSFLCTLRDKKHKHISSAEEM